MGQGTLRVSVTAADGALPVAGAQVAVSDAKGRVLYRLVTDADGLTEGVPLAAPGRETTLQPGGEAYAAYNVTVSKEGFVTAHIVGAEVLDALAQTQPVALTPRVDGGESEQTTVVSDNALKQDPPQRPQSGGERPPRTLGAVVVPSRITVHMGVPTDASAKNLTVRFPDYIKNVVASEIYATWPEFALEANARAIISLALSRVYTEWYRVQGYPFDITNSTRFDQYYKEGQTIPDNISRLVDSIFDEYLRRPGHREPLFSSYCNGTTATCPGMSQWGTVGLANAGYPALSILKYYYGEDLETAQTDGVADMPASYPGYTLSQGNQGPLVARMQTYLNRIATNFPLIAKLVPDGQYGGATAAAVRTFQRIFGLSQSGAIDRATWNRISYIYLAVTKLAELQSEGQTVGVGKTPPTSVLRQGAQGGDVPQLQFLLNAVGAFYGEIPPVREDAAFDAATAQAVRAFQRRFGLNADGIVGPATWGKLYAVYKSLNLGGNTDPAVPAAPPYPGVVLRQGMAGESVRLLQTYLNRLADRSPSVPHVTADGVFGRATRASVRAAQRLLGLTPDGLAGPATWAALVK
jgi:peptidoglycan hydrolase-like protein with peptidoglycan-binding domain